MAGETARTKARQRRSESRERLVAAAESLVRTRSYAELSVDAVTAEAGIGRTLFYRHFDDLADLVRGAAREASEALLAAEQAVADARPGDDPEGLRVAMTAAVAVYREHGPVLRAASEMAAADPEVAAGYLAMRTAFDHLAADSMAKMGRTEPRDELLEVARALNLMNEAYLLDAFGREPRIDDEVAVRTLARIWDAVAGR